MKPPSRIAAEARFRDTRHAALKKAEATPRDPTDRPPSAKTVAARLAGLTAAAMPWLSKDVDLTPLDGGPEAIGPAVYKPPPGKADR